MLYGSLLAFAAAVLFAASTPASKLLLEQLAPFQLAGLLYLGAAAGMGPEVWYRRRSHPLPRLDRRNRVRLAGAVLFGGAIGPVLLLFGLRLASAGSVSLLLNLEMVATAVLGVLLFGEHLGRLGWLGAAGVAGAGALLAGQGGWPGLAAALLVAGACACWGLDNHFTALIDGLTPAQSTLWKGLVAGTTNLSLGLLGDPLDASAAAVAAGLAVGALAYGASIALYIAAAQQIGATRAQGVFASAPFLGAMLAVGVLGEPLSPAQGVAALLLVGSVALLFLDSHEHPHQHPAVAHVHSHRHDDDHHLHRHPEGAPTSRHSHWHEHQRLVHRHPHWPDVHHRHPHAKR